MSKARLGNNEAELETPFQIFFYISKTAEFLLAGEAHKATFWHTPDLKEGNFDSCVFSTEGTLPVASEVHKTQEGGGGVEDTVWLWESAREQKDTGLDFVAVKSRHKSDDDEESPGRKVHTLENRWSTLKQEVQPSSGSHRQ